MWRCVEILGGVWGLRRSGRGHRWRGGAAGSFVGGGPAATWLTGYSVGASGPRGRWGLARSFGVGGARRRARRLGGRRASRGCVGGTPLTRQPRCPRWSRGAGFFSCDLCPHGVLVSEPACFCWVGFHSAVAFLVSPVGVELSVFLSHVETSWRPWCRKALPRR